MRWVLPRNADENIGELAETEVEDEEEQEEE
jgi:hypothetical protein